MNALKTVFMTKDELMEHGYVVTIRNIGYQVVFDGQCIDKWLTPGSELTDNVSGMEPFFESMALEAVKKHYCKTSDIAELKPGDEFKIYNNTKYRVESIDDDVVHCVMVAPVAPNGADVTQRFKLSDLTLAVDIRTEENES